MVNINIQIPDELHKKLKIEAITKDSSLKEHIISKLNKKVSIGKNNEKSTK